MNKNQNPNTLKVRNACDWPLSTNHNQVALKVRKGVTSNHNQIALKVRKAVDLPPGPGKQNHNETMLKVK